MITLRRLRPLAFASTAVLLAACNPAQVRDDEVLDAGPEKSSGDLYAELGREYMKQGQPRVALRKLQRGLEQNPDNPRVHAVLGLLYQRLGEYAAADRHFAEASDLDPQNPYYRNAWGSFLCERSRYPEADLQFQQALGNPLYDRPWQAATNAGVCALRAGDRDQAEGYLRRALGNNPRVGLALQKMAEIQLEKQDFTDAARYLQRFEQVAPHNPQTLLQGQRIYLGLQDAETAERYRDALKERFPDAPETRTAEELAGQ